MNTTRLPDPSPSVSRWLNRTVLGIGLASLFSDWSHEIATAVLPAFLADRFDKRRLFAGGYALAAGMALSIIVLPVTVWTLALLFAIGGVSAAGEETLEDSLCAELVGEAHHGMAFGTLATMNGVGNFVSSVVVGALWTWAGTVVALGYCAVKSSCSCGRRCARNARGSCPCSSTRSSRRWGK